MDRKQFSVATFNLFNLQNATDERYIIKLRNPHFAVPAPGRQALLTLIARY